MKIRYNINLLKEIIGFNYYEGIKFIIIEKYH